MNSTDRVVLALYRYIELNQDGATSRTRDTDRLSRSMGITQTELQSTIRQNPRMFSIVLEDDGRCELVALTRSGSQHGKSLHEAQSSRPGE